jgi:hypothetical protein
MTDLEALEGLTAGDVIVFQFGETVWVGAVVSDPETQSMYRDNNPTRVVRTTAQRGQFGKYADRDGDTVLVPLASVLAF